MAVPTVSSGFHAASQQPLQSLAPAKHSTHRPFSLGDIETAGSGAGPSGSATGKSGSKVDISV